MQMVQIYHNSVSDFLVNENALNSIASQDITYVYVAPPRGELETPMTDEQRAEIAAAEAAAEAKRQEEETTIYVGDRFDVLDTVAAWRVAQITKMHKTVKRSTHRAHSDDPDQRERVVTRTEVKLLFNYVGWPSKWDEWILLGSKRIEPLHTYTKGKSTTRHYNRKVELDVPLETTINLHLRHRLLKPVQEYFLHPFEPEVFHTPMLVFVNKDTTTCADLYQLVWKRAGLYTAVPERAGLTG
jgi:hypothetical protein